MPQCWQQSGSSHWRDGLQIWNLADKEGDVKRAFAFPAHDSKSKNCGTFMVSYVNPDHGVPRYRSVFLE